ncbi:M20/M25/M40 family metallo-hydrolase [bacterium]|nr:M20/M25/M40 family metallo-hydrolase [bacterium]
MKKIFSLFLCLTCLSFSDNPLSEDEKSALQSIQVNTLKAHLTFLQDDLMEGREAGERGNLIAANYIAGEFEKLGLIPKGDGGSYFQSVKLVSAHIQPETKLTLNAKKPVQFAFDSDFLLYNYPQTDTVIKKELVFARYGITAPEYNYDDFKDLDVKDKIVVIFAGEPISADSGFFMGNKNSKYALLSHKSKAIKRLGAAGALVLATPEHAGSYKFLSNYLGHRTVSLNRDYVHSNSENSDFVFPVLNPDASKQFAENIGWKFDEVAVSLTKQKTGTIKNATVEITVKSNRRYFDSPNVVGLLEGSDPELTKEYVILSAHFDHIGITKPVDGDSINNGATDNASGTSALLNAAEAFAKLKIKPKRSILLVACTAEEKGLLGSKFYAENPTIDLSKAIANINMDVIGFATSEKVSSITLVGDDYTTLGATMQKWARFVGLTPLPDLFPEQNFFQRSDNYNFSVKGVPSISPGAGTESKADFDVYLKYYHKPSDQLGKVPFSFNVLRLQAQCIFLSALDVANAQEKPKWLKKL